MSARSMTGFARTRRAVGSMEAVVSLKSVNHKGLDIHFHLPALLDPFESQARAIIKKSVERGHVQVHIALEGQGLRGGGSYVNLQALEQWKLAFEEVSRILGSDRAPDPHDALRAAGVLQQSSNAPEWSPQLEQELIGCLRDALEDWNAFRIREGEAIAAEMRERAAAVETLCAEMEAIRSTSTQAFHHRLKERLSELLHGAAIDPQRLAQEAAILADRSDISEEIMRLKTHTAQLTVLLDANGEKGKKLDFLLQEMNRESNTILSKTGGLGDHGLTLTALALSSKAEIDKCVNSRLTSNETLRMKHQPTVFIISAPSGSGKSTLVSRLLLEVPLLTFSVSYTTRAPRGAEQNGESYFFTTRSDFEARVANDEFLEYADVFGNYYGTHMGVLETASQMCCDLVLDIDVQGAAQLKKKVSQAVTIFVLPPSRQKLEERLRFRSEDPEAVIERRLRDAAREIRNYQSYDYVLINDILDETSLTLAGIIRAERVRRSRIEDQIQPILATFQ